MLDRLVGYISPGAGLARVRDRTMLASLTGTGGYKGGKLDRRATKNWRPGGNSADADLLPELDDLRARSRDLARNLPVATGAIATNKTHVVGDGLVLSAQCARKVLGISQAAADAFNRLAEWEFELWSQSADFTRVQHFAEQQALMLGGALESGDIFAIRRYRLDAGDTYGTKIQVIEGDRVCNPGRMADTETLVAGIEHLPSGVPIAIHVADRHPGDRRARAISWRRVPMRYNDGRKIVIHLFDRHRPDQTRGIPYLAPVVEALKSLGDYTDAEVRAAVVSAMFTVFVKKSPDADSSPLATTDTNGSSGKDEIELGSGAVIDLAEGEDIVTAAPGRPNPQFDAFVTAFLRQIGVALELPFELLIKHFTASYSASRAALEMAYHSFRRRRTWLVRNLCQVAYEWMMEEAILLGRISAPGFFDDPLIRAAWLNASWTGPVRISLDPKKDAEADEIDRRNGFKTSQQIMTERTGGDFDDKTEQLAREDAARKSAGIEPHAPDPVAPPSPPQDPEDEKEDV
ncbi:phage portal protein [Aminobacter aminovorans]|uniref:phage portal protein n=1 Tax=Aminobacter aminovorans TaxID=83263 RepID=UPI00285A3B25|nr:phage portal protein [Aminobacter aminovorans]MDR7220349.1 lambda family phage portal protein [Aminobacter aminovorans]